MLPQVRTSCQTALVLRELSQNATRQSGFRHTFVDKPALADMWDDISYLDTSSRNTAQREKAIRQRWIVSLCLDHYENIYVQHELGNLPDRIWPRWERHLTHVLGRESIFRETWVAFRAVYYPPFVAFVDRILESEQVGAASDTPATPPAT